MNSTKGIVKEVYLPIYDDTKIGFKVEINNEIINIEEPMNEENSKIYREDTVIVNEDIINNARVYTIEKEDYND